MANKTILPYFQVFTDATMTGTTVLTSSPSNIIYKDNVCYSLIWTGTPTGVFSVQGSTDYNPGLPQTGGTVNAGTWHDLPLSDVNGLIPLATGVDGKLMIDLNELPFAWVRVLYTNTSGAGTLNGSVSGKALGV